MYFLVYVFLYFKHLSIISALKHEVNFVLSSQTIICKIAVPLLWRFADRASQYIYLSN